MSKDSNIKFRISSEEKQVLKELASEKNMSLTDYILSMLYKAINQEKSDDI